MQQEIMYRVISVFMALLNQGIKFKTLDSLCDSAPLRDINHPEIMQHPVFISIP